MGRGKRGPGSRMGVVWGRRQRGRGMEAHNQDSGTVPMGQVPCQAFLWDITLTLILTTTMPMKCPCLCFIEMPEDVEHC